MKFTVQSYCSKAMAIEFGIKPILVGCFTEEAEIEMYANFDDGLFYEMFVF